MAYSIALPGLAEFEKGSIKTTSQPAMYLFATGAVITARGGLLPGERSGKEQGGSKKQVHFHRFGNLR